MCLLILNTEENNQPNGLNPLVNYGLQSASIHPIENELDDENSFGINCVAGEKTSRNNYRKAKEQ
jgi:hypothetical protein